MARFHSTTRCPALCLFWVSQALETQRVSGGGPSASANTDPIPTHDFVAIKEPELISAVTVLLVIFAIGLLFSSARWIGVACIAAFLLPSPACFLILLVVGAAYLVHKHFR